MIKDLILFAEQIDSNESSRITARETKNPVIIINTSEESDSIKFTGFELFDDKNDQKLIEFFGNIPDLEIPINANEIRNWIKKQNKIRKSSNKKLGSTSGLMNSVPYVVIMSKKNYAEFEKKTIEMKPPKEGWKTFPELQNKLTEDIKQVYIDFWKKQEIDEEKLKESIIFVVLPKKIGTYERKKLYSAFEEDRKNEWENADNNSKIEMNCPICGELGILGTHSDDTYQDKKPFYHRYDRPESIGFRLCLKCTTRYDVSKETLFSAGFRIFPLFSKDHIPNGMYFISDEGKAKNFREIITELREKTKRDIFDFQLVALSGDRIWLCDYITGYSPFFQNGYSRFYAEHDIWHILGLEKYYPYFDDPPKSRYGSIRSAIYAMRDKIFNYVYRGENQTLAIEDINQITDLRIKELIRNISKPEKDCKKTLESAIRLLDKACLRWKDMVDISQQDQENAKMLGKAFRIVTNLSEAENKHNLLTLALDKPKIDGVKSVLSRLLDRFHHKFNELESDEQKIISNCLDAKYSIDRFDLLKTYFYIGYFNVEVKK